MKNHCSGAAIVATPGMTGPIELYMTLGMRGFACGVQDHRLPLRSRQLVSHTEQHVVATLRELALGWSNPRVLGLMMVEWWRECGGRVPPGTLRGPHLTCELDSLIPATKY